MAQKKPFLEGFEYKIWTREFWKELFRPKTKEEYELGYRKSLWSRSDKLDIFAYFLLLIFFIAIFQNVTYLSSGVAELREFAIRNLAVATLGGAGLGLKALFDNATMKRDKVEYKIFLTHTEYETTTWRSVLYTFIWFAVAFVGQFLMSLFLNLITPLSIFEQRELTFAIIGSVAEEIFFALAIQSVLMARLKVVAIPIVIFVFGWYHLAVYQSFELLLYVALLRLIYTIVYLVSRRFSSVALAHLVNNILASGVLGL
jgi:membrane protease YdiL (CAAX protease family)